MLQKDWKYQVACIQNRWWVNRVGTYGMASAQLYWGRKASLVLRLLYYIFPQVDWHLVFVDDYCWALRCSRADWDATAILATLLALAVPLSWKKTALSPVNTGKPFLQPFWSWKKACTTSGRPPKLVRALAILLKNPSTRGSHWHLHLLPHFHGRGHLMRELANRRTMHGLVVGARTCPTPTSPE